MNSGAIFAYAFKYAIIVAAGRLLLYSAGGGLAQYRQVIVPHRAAKNEPEGFFHLS